ncbi:MAG TPA: hypothetical protein VNV43_01315 [Candidatus Acidoferrales bacterium]|nr:hypothetical protein [Candidatus Acidoferrales bacterium]
MTKKQENPGPNYVALLRRAIEERHKCGAVHRESVYVHETWDDQTIWSGEVEVFDLTGHGEAVRCYAWWHREKGAGNTVFNSEKLQLITVLGKRLVDSPEKAVRAAIFYDVQPAPMRDPDSR